MYKIFFSQHGGTFIILETINKCSLIGDLGFSGGLDSKESTYSEGDLQLIPGSGRSPKEGNGNPLQYSCLEKSHGQRNLAGYKSMGSQRVRHD